MSSMVSGPPNAPARTPPLGRMVLAQVSMETRLLLRNGEQLLLALVIPLLVLVAGSVAARHLGMSGEDPVGRLTPGVMALAVLSTSFTSLAISTGFERRYGVLKWLGSTPLPRSGLLLGKVGSLLLVELGQLLVVALVARLLGWSPQVGPGTFGGMVLGVVLGTAAFASLALLMAGTLRAEATLASANLVFVLLAVGGGVVIAPAEYGSFAPVVQLLPSGALHDLFAQALQHASVDWSAALVLAVWTAVGTVLTARTFTWE